MSIDTNDVSSLISYINDIKPFHSKLTDVVVEYQTNDSIGVAVTDSSKIAVKLSSVWELPLVSDGTRTTYRMPAAAFPRHSRDYHRSSFVGVTDAIPGKAGVYSIPYNNGVIVSVNGVKKAVNVDYTVSSSRSEITFSNGRAPLLNDSITFDWTVLDRVFIGVGETLHEYTAALGGIDNYQLDTNAFDSAVSTYFTVDWVMYDLVLGDASTIKLYPTANKVPTSITNSASTDQLNTAATNVAILDPIGYVDTRTDQYGEYSVFTFYTPLPLNSKIWIRVEQREAYNGWTQTRFTETLTFADLVKFADTVNVKFTDPSNWLKSQFEYDAFDSDQFDSTDYSSVTPLPGESNAPDSSGPPSSGESSAYPKTFSEYSDLKETAIATSQIADSLTIRVQTEEFFDIDSFDTTPYEYNFGLAASYYTPDYRGMVVVTVPSATIEISHPYDCLPIVAVYLDGKLTYPQAVEYMSSSVVKLRFTRPMKPVIRLA